uniref:Uncharacterized protein n=1 Tax=Anguilla anguilla TaxID=7936 RepID=A0A0E9VHC3_ANGAN
MNLQALDRQQGS